MLSLYVQKYLHRYDARLSKQHVFDNKYCGNPQERGGMQRHVDVSDGKGQIKTRAHRKIGKHKFD